MVFLNLVLNTVKEFKLPRPYLRKKFMDSLKVYVKGGTGGTGSPQYSGRGGQGGCVYCIGKEGVNLSKFRFKKSISAGHGEDSRKSKIVGNPGADKKIEVPLGVLIFDKDGKKLGSIDEEDTIVIVARGGPGGDPSNEYLGYTGQTREIRLELKLLADVVLLGFPNAGKSALLHSLSKAKPRIAKFPFTTIKPNKGTILYEDLRSISVVDLPGLVDGAHDDKGLGNQHLKHVERSKLLVIVADVNGFQSNPKYHLRSCLETVLLINKELELYESELLEKPAILVINKLDENGAEEKFKDLELKLSNINNELHNFPEELRPKKVMEFQNIIGTSALNGQGIDELKHWIRIRLDEFGEKNNANIKNPATVLKRIKSIGKETGPKLT